jgi:hypothetical protein
MVIVPPGAAAGGDRLPIAGFVTVNTLVAALRVEFTTATTGPVVTLLGGTDNPDVRGCGRVA